MRFSQIRTGLAVGIFLFSSVPMIHAEEGPRFQAISKAENVEVTDIRRLYNTRIAQTSDPKKKQALAKERRGKVVDALIKYEKARSAIRIDNLNHTR